MQLRNDAVAVTGRAGAGLPTSWAALGEALRAALLPFTAERRLYALEVEGHTDADWLVEAFAATESLNGLAERQVVVLATDAGLDLDLDALLGARATQRTTLADGSRSAHPGLIAQAKLLGADGGFARYHLTLVHWPWLLSQQTHDRIWQDKSLLAIVEAVFADPAYTDYAHWRCADDLAPFLAELPPRDYCVQYAETDWAFVSRLLGEEGIGLAVQPDDEAPAGHSVVLFADAANLPLDASALAAGGTIRYHRADSQETSDAVQRLAAGASLSASLLTVLGYIDSGKRAIAAQELVAAATGQPGAGSASATATPDSRLPPLEHYQPQLPRALQSAGLAARAARLWADAVQTDTRRFEAGSTIRSLVPGTRLAIAGLPLAPGRLDPADPAFTVASVASAGLNNLPAQAQAAALKLFGSALPTLTNLHPELDAERLRATGYANSAELVPAELSWRPRCLDAAGHPLHQRPHLAGCQTALVTGPDGSTTPNGADELHCDAQGRIRVRFHWQDGGSAADDDATANDTCWLRVAQRQAGAGYGTHFLPRIGQEVLVGFLGGDPDQPLVLGALYNGRGEPDATGQGNLTGGNAPAWHGAAPGPDAMRNAAALTGLKSKEFGGLGASQLIFDDTPGQLRVTLATSQATSQLALGHLLAQSDNRRQHGTGAGFALATQAYGAVRAQAGLLLSSYGASDGSNNSNGGSNSNTALDSPLPAGDFTAGLALLQQSEQLGAAMSQVAGAHQTLQLASHEGAAKAGSSQVDQTASPLKALHIVAKGTVAADGSKTASTNATDTSSSANPTDASAKTVPHFTAPALALHARSDMAHLAGQHLHQVASETLTQISGLDSHLSTGEQLRIHTGQGLGVLVGVVESKGAIASAGSGGNSNSNEAAPVNAKGLSLIAAQGPITAQAQADTLTLAAKQDLKLISANANLDFAAAKSIVLKTAGGASLTIEGGSITFACPGTLTVKAGVKEMTAGGGVSYALPTMPKGELRLDRKPRKFDITLQDVPGVHGHPQTNAAWAIVHEAPHPYLGLATTNPEGVLASGMSDEQGKVLLDAAQEALMLEKGYPLTLLYGGFAIPISIEEERADWDEDDKAAAALKAHDFTDESHSHFHGDEGRQLLKAAQAKLKVASKAGLHDKLKKKG